MHRSSRPETIRNLQERLRQIEQSARPASEVLLVTSSGLDQLLPGGGWTPGTLIEWLSEAEGSGAATLALAVAAELLQHQGGALVVIDTRGELYPPAVASLGVPLERTVVIRPQSATDALWALEQSLRSGAAAVALAWIETASDSAFRKLQLAAETGGNFGFLLRPAVCRCEPSWAQARLWVEASAAHHPLGRWGLRASVLHRRGGAPGQAVEVELRSGAPGLIPRHCVLQRRFLPASPEPPPGRSRGPGGPASGETSTPRHAALAP